MTKAIVISDFDGTITLQDVNDAIFKHFGDKVTAQIEDLFREGEIGLDEALTRHYSRLNLSEREFTLYVKRNIKIDPFFKIFYQEPGEKDVDFAIVSGGFHNYIDIIFTENRIKMRDPVYANRLSFKENNIEIKFLHNAEELKDCHQYFGICGNCKYKIVHTYKEKGKPVIYIGDGLTDRCAVEEADYVLAKKGESLAEYCQIKGIDFNLFMNFKDVKQIIFNIILPEIRGSEN